MNLKSHVPEFAERIFKHFKQRVILNVADEALPREIFGQKHYHKISFVTTCMNRLFQLRKTYLKNIADNAAYPHCEFVLINYNSGDGLDGWVAENLGQYIQEGKVKYFHAPDPEVFHAAHAKNLAHFLSTGDIVCNLDGDNFTGKDFAFYINYLFNTNQSGQLLLTFSKDRYYGTYGRICLTREHFVKLGGYDEDLHNVGGEDVDLMLRAMAFGLEHRNVEIENFLKYIENTNKERVKNTGLQNSFEHYNKLNKIKTEQNVKNNVLTANAGKTKTARMYKNLSGTLQEIAYLGR